MNEEIFDIVNDRDEVIGQLPRAEVHRDAHKHRATHILVFNKRGEVFLQKRSKTKDTFPGAWDSSASGHLHSGEDYDTCAVREVKEELGLAVNASPVRLFRIAACAETQEEFVWVYRVDSEGPLAPDWEEIDCGGWFAPAHVSHWINVSPADFASGFIMVWGIHTGARPTRS
jgi:isopentenyl-diphosphate delta-isomerase type 1